MLFALGAELAASAETLAGDSRHSDKSPGNDACCKVGGQGRGPFSGRVKRAAAPF